MKIINAHVHLIEIKQMAAKYASLQLQSGISVLKELEATLPLLSVDTLIQQMDDAGIDISVLYAVNAPIVFSSNEFVHSICQKYPTRFIGFASVDPKSASAVQELEHAVVSLGLRGLKLHPPLQDFSPDDPLLFPIYEKALELNIPVVFHVGSTPFGSMCRLKHANPLLIDEVAVTFPNLRILLTHLGTLWHNESFMVVEKNPNVFIDTAAYLYEIPSILTRDLLERIGTDKVIFGTDYPMPYAGVVHRMKDFVQCIQSLGFPDDILQGIFNDNFTKLLNGTSEPSAGLSLQEILSQMFPQS